MDLNHTGQNYATKSRVDVRYIYNVFPRTYIIYRTCPKKRVYQTTKIAATSLGPSGPTVQVAWWVVSSSSLPGMYMGTTKKWQFLDLTNGCFQTKGDFPPKSSILIGFSIINHPFWGNYPYFLGTSKLWTLTTCTYWSTLKNWMFSIILKSLKCQFAPLFDKLSL